MENNNTSNTTKYETALKHFNKAYNERYKYRMRLPAKCFQPAFKNLLNEFYEFYKEDCKKVIDFLLDKIKIGEQTALTLIIEIQNLAAVQSPFVKIPHDEFVENVRKFGQDLKEKNINLYEKLNFNQLTCVYFGSQLEGSELWYNEITNKSRLN